jgi:hypothetical protein
VPITCPLLIVEYSLEVGTPIVPLFMNDKEFSNS